MLIFFLSKRLIKVLQGLWGFAGLKATQASPGHGTTAGCPLQRAAPCAWQRLHRFGALLHVPYSGVTAAPSSPRAGRSGLHTGFPWQLLQRGDPRQPHPGPPQPLPVGPGCSCHLLSPFARQCPWDTNKPLVFPLPVPGPYMLWLRLPPAWGFAASLALAVHS